MELMPAGLKSVAVAACAAMIAASALQPVRAAECVSPNFRVQAPTEKIARQVAATAEKFRKKLAIQWYGHEIPNWGERCSVRVRVGKNLGAGGSTRFRFDRGEVYGWNMEVQGSLERVLDSVIPHEVNHTILACYFRRKVPRWADEGAATVVEHISEKQRQVELAERLVREGNRIPLRVLLSMTQYPSRSKEIMAMYAQGYSLTQFLLQRGGRRHFLRFLKDAHHRGWERAIAAFYDVSNIESLEQKWTGWVLAGSPAPSVPEGQLLADNTQTGQSANSGQSAAATPPQAPVVRSQSPEPRDTTKLASKTSGTRQRNASPEPIWERPEAAGRPSDSPGRGRASQPAVAIARVGRTQEASSRETQSGGIRPAVRQGNARGGQESARGRQSRTGHPEVGEFGRNLSAPDPRGIAMSRTGGGRNSSHPASVANAAPVPAPQEPAAAPTGRPPRPIRPARRTREAGTTRSAREEKLQPLALTRIDNTASTSASSPEPHGSAQMSVEWPSVSDSRPGQSASTNAANARKRVLRETRIRKAPPRQTNARSKPDWNRFPQQVR